MVQSKVATAVDAQPKPEVGLVWRARQTPCTGLETEARLLPVIPFFQEDVAILLIVL